jgi:hypothetical protein
VHFPEGIRSRQDFLQFQTGFSPYLEWDSKYLKDCRATVFRQVVFDLSLFKLARGNAAWKEYEEAGSHALQEQGGQAGSGTQTMKI